LPTSQPDDFSPLTGRELIVQSVDKLVQMGGGFPHGEEFNFVINSTAARRVVENWATPIVFSGMEIGGRISAGEQLLRTPGTNPVRMAYRLHTQGWMKGFGFDHTAVIYAVRGLRSYWTLSEPGSCAIDEKGSNTWKNYPDGRHRHLVQKKPPEKMARIIEDLMSRYPKFVRHENDPMEDKEVLEDLEIVEEVTCLEGRLKCGSKQKKGGS
jgi:purine nucleosidase